MDIKTFEEYIKKVRWQNAKTYEKTAPHEYTVRWWRKDLEREFIDAVIFIRINGVEEMFYNKPFIYLYHGDYKYWTMGAPLNTTRVLNRALIEDYPNNRYKGG